jgi:hypothetical protein
MTTMLQGPFSYTKQPATLKPNAAVTGRSAAEQAPARWTARFGGIGWHPLSG